MRKIEERMLEAISYGIDFKERNTEVVTTYDWAAVYLHGNLICLIGRHSGCRYYSSGGWMTATTKSRLNALGAGIYQRDFVWYNPDGTRFHDADLVNLFFRFDGNIEDHNLFPATAVAV